MADVIIAVVIIAVVIIAVVIVAVVIMENLIKNGFDSKIRLSIFELNSMETASDTKAAHETTLDFRSADYFYWLLRIDDRSFLVCALSGASFWPPKKTTFYRVSIS